MAKSPLALIEAEPTDRRKPYAVVMHNGTPEIVRFPSWDTLRNIGPSMDLFITLLE